MAMFIDCNGVYDNKLSELYLTFKLIATFSEQCSDLGSHRKIDLKINPTILVDDKGVDNLAQIDDADSDKNTLDTRNNYSLIGGSGVDRISFELEITSNLIVLRKFKFGDLNLSLGDFTFTFKELFGICFKPKSLRKISSYCDICQNVFKINLNCGLNLDIENMPEPYFCDKSVCNVLHGPNIDLLNDWLFCHNHSHGASDNHSIQIPDEAQKPVILDRLEQIVYLLVYNDSDKILLESCDDKNQSIYLELIRKDIYTIQYYDDKNLSSLDDTLEETINLSNLIANINLDGSTPHSSVDDNNNTDIDLNIFPKCLVQCKIFGKFDQELWLSETNDLMMNKFSIGNSIQHYENYFCSGVDDMKPLTKYRMSFDVEWFRIDGKLFHLLTNHLIKSNLRINRILQINQSVEDLILPSHQTEIKGLFIGSLDLYKFC